MAKVPPAGPQGTLYGLLTPLALLAVAVWLVEAPQLQLLAGVFTLCSAVMLCLLSKSLGIVALTPRALSGMALVMVVVIGLAWNGVLLPVTVTVLMILSILRLWYLRQYHARLGQSRVMELLRRSILLSLWSHSSVLVALLNPY